MKTITLMLLGMIATFAIAQSAPIRGAELSPAEQSMAEASRAIREQPAQYQGYNLLATALIRRALETGNADYYDQATGAITKSQALSPNNFETEKIRVAVLLGEHEYPSALDAARALNKKTPDDVMVYGLLTDANIALGNYADAEAAAQWMLNLRTGNVPALLRAARLRELFGDNEGAYELLDLAYQSTPPTEAGDRASVITRLGNLRLSSGNIGAAEKLFQQALSCFPSYPSALEGLAQVRVEQKNYDGAVALLQQAHAITGETSDLYRLAAALQRAGRDREATKAFTEFESQALLTSGKKNNANRELVFYYADYAHQPLNALKVAGQDYAWRHDFETLDAYAWALHVNGQNGEARKQIEAALAVGVRDQQVFRHAAEIARKSGSLAAAEQYRKQADELNGSDSGAAQATLTNLSHQAKP